MIRLMKPRTRYTALIAALGILALVPAFSPAAADDQKQEKTPGGEAELARLLEGRVAGDPVRCLRDTQYRGVQIIDKTAMVFRDGRTLYVNRTNAPRFLDDGDLPVFKIFGSSLCGHDQVEMRDRFARGTFGGPIVVLDDFIPYNKPDADIAG